MQILKSKKGNTLVEVMVAFTLMLLLIGVFWSAISFSKAAQGKAAQIRADVTEAATLLRSDMAARPTVPAGATETYSFTAKGGAGALFSIQVEKIERTVKLEDGSERTFFQFQSARAKPEPPKPGGGT